MTRAAPRPAGALLALALAVGLLGTGAPTGDALVPAPLPAPADEALGCDRLDPAACLLPFPNDAFTVADETTDTGRRVDLAATAMPRNGVDLPGGALGGAGLPVEPTEWNRNDGFSPGSPVITSVPGLDLHATWGTADRAHSAAGPNEPGYFDHRDHIADVALYERPDAPIVILDATTGERHPFWSELDQHPDATDERRALVLRPATNFAEGHRYIVALRELRDADGEVLPAGDAFAALRDGDATGERADHHEELFATLEAAGIGRDDLYLAWDFTVASERNLTERMLHIRDDAFGRVLGDEDLADRRVAGDAPSFAVASVEERQDTWTDSRGREQQQAYRRIRGTVTVPNYLDRPQSTGADQLPTDQLPTDTPPLDALPLDDVPLGAPPPLSRLYQPPGGDLPAQNPAVPEVQVPWVCDVPVGEGASFGTLYGHGLLGARDQIGDVAWPRRYGFAGCAVDWWGMSTGDVPTVALILLDLSHFASLPDRAQQGFLNFLFLGRAMVHPDGFASHEAFQADDGAALLVVDDGDGTRLFFDGNSQGGIMGGALTAISPDIHRAILGVPAMNYATLLNRSVDWEGAYGEVLYAGYQDPIERQLAFALIQMLWDRGEANGFAHHVTDDPLPNTPPHEVLLQVAFSDHQVTNHAAEVQARTLGAPIMTPGLPAGRHWERTPYFTPTATYPHDGSALVYWDSGNAPPPNGNLPADEGEDPHGDPRDEPAAGWQEAHFLLTGQVADVCGGEDYLTMVHPDNAGTPSCRAPRRPPGTGAGGPATPTPAAELTGRGSATSRR